VSGGTPNKESGVGARNGRASGGTSGGSDTSNKESGVGARNVRAAGGTSGGSGTNTPPALIIASVSSMLLALVEACDEESCSGWVPRGNALVEFVVGCTIGLGGVSGKANKESGVGTSRRY
jgi:hypothetical protein